MCCGYRPQGAPLSSGDWHSAPASPTASGTPSPASADGPYLFIHPGGQEQEVQTWADADSLARKYGGSIIRKAKQS